MLLFYLASIILLSLSGATADQSESCSSAFQQIFTKLAKQENDISDINLLCNGTRQSVTSEIQQLKSQLANDRKEFHAQFQSLAAELGSLRSDLNESKTVILEETRKLVQNLKEDLLKILIPQEPPKKLDCNQNHLDLVLLSDGKKYHFSDRHEDWHAAKEICERNSMHLASPKTQQEIILLRRKGQDMRDFSTWYWVSASDVGRKGVEFAWHDGEILPANSSLWKKDEFGQENEVCGYIHTEGEDKIVDMRCSFRFNYICQLPPECN